MTNISVPCILFDAIESVAVNKCFVLFYFYSAAVVVVFLKNENAMCI